MNPFLGSCLKSLKRYKIRLCSVFILFFYYAFVLLGNLFIKVDFDRIPFLIPPLLLYAFILSLVIHSFGVRQFKKISFKLNVKKITWSQWSILGFFPPFFSLLFYFLAYAPGGFSYDSLLQYEQAHTDIYSDWHPYFHTLLFFKFPLSIVDSPTSIILFQILLYSFFVSYFVVTLKKYGAPNVFVFFSLCYLSFNTKICSLVVIAWKDTAMAIFSLLLVTFFVHIKQTEGAWLLNVNHKIMFAMTITLVSTMRHNAILLTIPAILYVYLLVPLKKRTHIGQSTLLFSMLFLFIIFPLSEMVAVNEPDERVVEIVGLPMTMLGSAVSFSPYLLEENTLEFLYEVARPELWTEKIQKNNVFNDIKWSGADRDVIEAEGLFSILNHTFSAIELASVPVFHSFYSLTAIVWSPSYVVIDTPYIMENEVNIQYYGNESARELIFLGQEFLTSISGIVGVASFFYSVGFVMLTILTLVVLKDKDFFTNISCILPIFVYNLGTMLLLSGRDTRFFSYTLFMFPGILFLILYDKNDVKEEIVDEMKITEEMIMSAYQGKRVLKE